MNHTFKQKAFKKARSVRHHKTISYNISQYTNSFNKGIERVKNIAFYRSEGKRIKEHTIEKLADYLLAWERNAIKQNIQVLWAKDVAQAQGFVAQIAKENKARRIVKSKSMVSEEIGLRKFLRKMGISVFETDLGEYIVDLLKEKPYHIVTPAMHLSKKDVVSLFHKKFQTPLDAKVEDLNAFVRSKLRKEYFKADIGITGVNFLIADQGGISITENEGNARLCASIPDIHIGIVGIEKIIPSIKHLSLFNALLSLHATGQPLTVYNTFISGARKGKKRYIILLDNGRSEIYAKVQMRSALHCIRCGACMNFCPVYKAIGGHSYGSTYAGPIGAVVAPYLEGKKFYHLNNVSTLCGQCTAVCPVKIPIHELIWQNRVIYASEKKRKSLFWSLWAWMVRKKWLLLLFKPWLKLKTK